MTTFSPALRGERLGVGAVGCSVLQPRRGREAGGPEPRLSEGCAVPRKEAGGLWPCCLGRVCSLGSRTGFVSSPMGPALCCCGRSHKDQRFPFLHLATCRAPYGPSSRAVPTSVMVAAHSVPSKPAWSLALHSGSACARHQGAKDSMAGQLPLRIPAPPERSAWAQVHAVLQGMAACSSLVFRIPFSLPPIFRRHTSVPSEPESVHADAFVQTMWGHTRVFYEL